MMIGMSIVQLMYRFHYLVTMDVEIETKIYKSETYKLKEPLFILKPNRIFIGRSQICEKTETFGARGNPGFDGNTYLAEKKEKMYEFVSGFETI